MERASGPTWDAFFRQMRAAPRRLLMLDYDGTLAPFQVDRAAAHPYPEARPRLERLATHRGTRTVIISGRALDDLIPLLDLDPLPELWGSHGWERRAPDGTTDPPALPAATLEALRTAWRWVGDRALESRAERKPTSVALHWRGTPVEQAAALEADARSAWRPLVAGADLELHAFDGGLELRAAGRGKDDAVRAILREYEGDAPCAAYLGDDRTDEDAFAALAGRGLRVLVRPQRRESAADWWLVPPAELLRFLDDWLAAAEGGAQR